MEGYQRGQHKKGDYTVGQDLKIETMDSNQQEEINIVLDIKKKINTL